MSGLDIHMIYEGRRVRAFEQGGAVTVRIIQPVERVDGSDGLARMIDEVNGTRREMEELAAVLVTRAEQKEREGS